MKVKLKIASQFWERKLVAKQIIGQEREVKCEICFNFSNFRKWKEKYILFPFVREVKWKIKFNSSPGNYQEVIKGVPSISATVPWLTSDMGTKTVLANYCLLPQRANSGYILSIICFATNFLSKNWEAIFKFHFHFPIQKKYYSLGYTWYRQGLMI